MLRQEQIEREFKANDHMAINNSHREMERQGYEVFRTQKFKKRNIGKTLLYSANPIVGLALGKDDWVRILYRLKMGQNRW